MQHRLTPIEAARFGKSVEYYRLFWMEDLTPAESYEVLPPDLLAYRDADCGW